MSLLWMDGFDHYGSGATGVTNMTQGTYASVTGSGPVTAQARTGTFSLQLGNETRRIFGAAKTKVGVGYGAYPATIPSANTHWYLASFNNASNTVQVQLRCSTVGEIIAYRGDGVAELGRSAQGVLVAGAWQHIEISVFIHDTAGTVEARVNGATVLSLTSVDTNQALGEVSQVDFRRSTGTTYIDDLFAWDSSGSSNNDFLGDCRVRTLMPTGNESTQEWVANTGAAWDAINDTAPDGETTYIFADPVGSSPPYTTSEFTLADLPAEVSSIVALQTQVMTRKTDAGVANLQNSLVSGAFVSAGADRALTTVYTYWSDVHQVDPATGAAWTRTAVNAAKLRLRRTAE